MDKQITWIALHRTWTLFVENWKKVSMIGVLIPIAGLIGGIFATGFDAVMGAVYGAAVLGFFMILVFLYQLWLAPFRVLEDWIKGIAPRTEESDPSVCQASSADCISRVALENWKRKDSVMLVDAADLCAEVAPKGFSKIDEMSVESRSFYEMFIEAGGNGRLAIRKGHVSHPWLCEINRKDLRNYFLSFTEESDLPEFLK